MGVINIPEVEMPDEFYESIRHLSSFRNREEYNQYLQNQIKLWQQTKQPSELARNSP